MVYKRKEADFLVSLLAAALGAPAPAVPDGGVDWDNLFALSTAQKVEAMTCAGLADVPDVPQTIRTRFEQAYKQEIAAHLVRRSEGVKLLNALEVNGIDCVPLKGWIMQGMYPNPALRYMCDMDVLFRPEQSADVQRVMEALDYVPQSLGGNPEVYYKRPVMNIEMHKRIFNDPIGYFDAVWDRVQPTPNCRHTFSMTWEDYYLYMIAHLHKHFTGGGTGVRYVCDTELFLRRHADTLDRAYVDSILEKIGMLAFERQLRKLCRVWFHAEPMDGDTDAFAERLLFSGVFGTPEQGLSNQPRNLILSQSGSTLHTKRLRFYLSVLFPPLQVMRDVFPVLQKAPFLLPFLWIWRLIHRLFTGRDKAKELMERAQMVTEEDVRRNY